MSDLYILQNQDKLFLGKQKDWLDGRDRNSLYKTPHKDEAVNLRVEISAKDFTQRISLLHCKADERGLPLIDAEQMPPAQPERAKAHEKAHEDESHKKRQEEGLQEDVRETVREDLQEGLHENAELQ